MHIEILDTIQSTYVTIYSNGDRKLLKSLGIKCTLHDLDKNPELKYFLGKHKSDLDNTFYTLNAYSVIHLIEIEGTKMILSEYPFDNDEPRYKNKKDLYTDRLAVFTYIASEDTEGKLDMHISRDKKQIDIISEKGLDIHNDYIANIIGLNSIKEINPNLDDKYTLSQFINRCSLHRLKNLVKDKENIFHFIIDKNRNIINVIEVDKLESYLYDNKYIYSDFHIIKEYNDED